MKPEIQTLLDKQKAGEDLGVEGIRTLMLYCLELLEEFGRLTTLSINRFTDSIQK